MKATTLYKVMSTAALGAALTFGAAATHAALLPTFKVDASVVGGPAQTFTADHIVGGASTLVQVTGANSIMGQGYLTFGGFTLNTAPVFGTGLNTSWGMYATFNYTATLTSGTVGSNDAIYDIDSLLFSLYGYDGSNPTLPVFNMASVTGSGAAGGTVTAGSNDREIGNGSLVVGTINSNNQSGTTVTTTNTYQNTAFGNTFFIEPNPFYTVVFESLTNNTSGITRDPAYPNYLAINAASNSTDFAVGSTVPEPGSLALLGASLIGLVGIRRRKSA